MQIRAINEIMKVEELHAWNSNPDTLFKYKTDIESEYGIPVIVANSKKEAVEQADILITTTRGKGDLVDAGWVKPGTHISVIKAACQSLAKASPWGDLAAAATGFDEERRDGCGQVELNDGNILRYAVIHLPNGQLMTTFVDVTDSMNPPEAPREVADALRARFGLDQPVHIQFLMWLQSMMVGDLGLSVFNNRPVAEELFGALANTLKLAIPAAVLGFAVVGVALVLRLVTGLFGGAVLQRQIQQIDRPLKRLRVRQQAMPGSQGQGLPGRRGAARSWPEPVEVGGVVVHQADQEALLGPVGLHRRPVRPPAAPPDVVQHGERRQPPGQRQQQWIHHRSQGLQGTRHRHRRSPPVRSPSMINSR
jgi:hypothetical protein